MRRAQGGPPAADSAGPGLQPTLDVSVSADSITHEAGDCRVCGRDSCDDLDHLAADRPMFAAALRYAAVGWSTFPLRAESKLPATESGFRDASRELAQLARWWPAGTRRNIGAPIPPGLVALDLDGPEAVRALQALDLDTPATARQRTPRGLHLIYRMPEGVDARQTAGELAPGVDTRAAGRGYLVVAPSVVGGVRYRWEVPPIASNIAEAPAWLVDKLAEQPMPRRDWRPIAGAVVGNGQRNVTLASVAGLLFRKLPALLAYDLAILWAEARCSPPLPAKEVERTLDSIAGAELRRRGAG